jgi:hypothetical protein
MSYNILLNNRFYYQRVLGTPTGMILTIIKSQLTRDISTRMAVAHSSHRLKTEVIQVGLT